MNVILIVDGSSERLIPTVPGNFGLLSRKL